jgi:hypothetical protein
MRLLNVPWHNGLSSTKQKFTFNNLVNTFERFIINIQNYNLPCSSEWVKRLIIHSKNGKKIAEFENRERIKIMVQKGDQVTG